MRLMLPPHRRQAFSLTELLLGIVILAALIMLTVHATSAARKQAENTTCVQRLRSVGAGIMAFAVDHQGRVLPRMDGLYRSPGEPQLPSIDRAWPNRLIRGGYLPSPDVLYCPSFTPKKNELAETPLPYNGKYQTYGMRIWTLPSATGSYWSNREREELKPLAAIETPADFFLVTDTIWIHPAYLSQGYGIGPGMGAEQLVHLRHGKMANAFFADGHVEAKPGSYFAELHQADRQRAYSAGQSLPFGVTDRMDWPKKE